jgi:hypothetical protein
MSLGFSLLEKTMSSLIDCQARWKTTSVFNRIRLSYIGDRENRSISFISTWYISTSWMFKRSIQHLAIIMPYTSVLSRRSVTLMRPESNELRNSDKTHCILKYETRRCIQRCHLSAIVQTWRSSIKIWNCEKNPQLNFVVLESIELLNNLPTIVIHWTV